MKQDFLCVYDIKVYKLMSSLLSPNKFVDKMFKELVSLMKSHYNPKVSIIEQKFKVYIYTEYIFLKNVFS